MCYVFTVGVCWVNWLAMFYACGVNWFEWLVYEFYLEMWGKGGRWDDGV